MNSFGVDPLAKRRCITLRTYELGRKSPGPIVLDANMMPVELRVKKVNDDETEVW